MLPQRVRRERYSSMGIKGPTGVRRVFGRLTKAGEEVSAPVVVGGQEEEAEEARGAGREDGADEQFFQITVVR